ncbi:hypothetical protein C8J56DRAFT_1111824 [Mycena floridula]|nr:hypothetical protein C8J56DRAFT_1111824 [Mycena floridula]
MTHLNISELLASPSLPTEGEREQLNQLLRSSNDEISRLTATIDKLVLQRETLQRNIASYKAIIAPIRLLPEDVLREIFVRCLPCSEAAATVTTDAPLLLGRICRSWRELALSTTALWTSIHVKFSHLLDLPRGQRLCQEVQTWLGRSGTCSLAINVEYVRLIDERLNADLFKDLVIDFIKSLTSDSTRWRSVEITAPSQFLLPLASLSQGDVPRLEKFSHSVPPLQTGTEVGENLWESLEILEGESLRDVSLRTFMPGNTTAVTSKLKLGQLTRLNLNTGSECTFIYAADILSRCPNLTACSLSITNCQDPGTASHLQPVTLLHLSTFTITFNYYAGELTTDSVASLVVSEKFFSNLNLPRLTSFSQNLGAFSICSWVNLFPASPIENLALSLLDLRDESVLHYLRTSTDLKRLRIENTWSFSLAPGQMDSILPQLMAIENPDDALCPFLEVLELEGVSIPDDVFVQLIRRRAALVSNAGIAHLKFVYANFHRTDVDVNVISQLEDLVASGLSLSISYPPHPSWESNISYWPSKLVELEWPM